MTHPSEAEPVNIAEFELYLRKEVDAFFLLWMECAGEMPENYPLEFPGVQDWMEQFLCGMSD